MAEQRVVARKPTKVEAEYRPWPSGLRRCRSCAMFRQPDGCSKVAGTFSRWGWCKYWKKKE